MPSEYERSLLGMQNLGAILLHRYELTEFKGYSANNLPFQVTDAPPATPSQGAATTMTESHDGRRQSPDACGCCDAHAAPARTPNCGGALAHAAAGPSCEQANAAGAHAAMPTDADDPAPAAGSELPGDNRPPSELERAVRTIQKGAGTQEEKSAAIHELFAAQRARVTATADRSRAAAKTGVFPGAGASRGCEHYSRNCWIKAACCDRYYPCRRCHDAAENHAIDRTATKFVACVVCGDKDQPVAESCRTCGVRFARYFCKTCRFYDDSPENEVYHCDDCGMCKRGKREDFRHCHKCNTCIPTAVFDNHPCRERNLDSNCPICGDYLGTSTEQVIFLACGHPIHQSCLKKHMLTSYICPICSKCIPPKEQMEPWYRKLDERLVHDRMPPELSNRVSQILCNDCEEKSVARFHFQFHRCEHCKGYNTRVLAQYDVDPQDQPPPLSVGGAVGAGPSALAAPAEENTQAQPSPEPAASATPTPPSERTEPAGSDKVCKPAKAVTPAGPANASKPASPTEPGAPAEPGGSTSSSKAAAASAPDNYEQRPAPEPVSIEPVIRQSSPCPVAEATG